MSLCARFVATGCVLAGCLTIGAADAPHLAAEQLARAVRNDTISIPTPGELFAALEKPGKPNWSGQFRGPLPTTYKNRAQIALNLGGLIADGFIAVEAQDGQQVKNIGSDFIKMSKALGVSENILSRGNSINEFAENSEWDALQEELETSPPATSSRTSQDPFGVLDAGRAAMGARKAARPDRPKSPLKKYKRAVANVVVPSRSTD